MVTHLAATAASCNTGTWQQQWQCGWNDHTAAAYKAGFFFGHNMLPILILVAFLFLVAKAAKRRKAGGRKVVPAAKAWKPAKMPARR